MIEVQNLSKYYGSFCAVNGVSFSVKEGEIVGFLGPNGAGKTTTLRVLTCFHPASSGTATVAGHDVFNESLAVRANIGYLPESVPLYTEMRAIEYLRFRLSPQPDYYFEQPTGYQQWIPKSSTQERG